MNSTSLRYFLACLLVWLAFSSPNLAAEEAMIPLQATDLAPDIQLITTSVIGIMRHRTELPTGVEIVDGARQMLSEPGFHYEGFEVSHISVVEYRPVGEDQSSRSLKLGLRFDDRLGRSAIVLVSAIYHRVGDVHRIEYATVREQNPTQPTIQLFAVPKKKVPRKLSKVAGSFTDLYSFAVKNAVPISDARKIPARAGRYLMMAFVGERLPPKARMDLLLDSQSAGLSGNSHGMQVLDYQGWRVLTMPVDLALKKAPSYFLKVVYTPGPDVPPALKGPRLVAAYATSDGEPVVAQRQPDAPVSTPGTPIAIATVSPPPATQAAVPKISGRWHQESQYGFKVQVPEGWRSQALQDGTDRVLTILSPDGNVAARVRAIPISGSIPVDRVISAFEQHVLGGGQRRAKQEDSLNGLRGVLTVYTGNFQGTDVGMAAFTTLQGRYAYILWGMIPLPYYDQRSGEVDAILNSFTLL